MTKQITIRMPKELLAKWLKALRRGGYIQTKHALYNPATGGFCCLGVLQHVASGGSVEIDGEGEYETMPSKGWLKSAGVTFRRRDFWTGRLKSCTTPLLPSLDATADEANDNDSRTFAEIADAIEACAEGF